MVILSEKVTPCVAECNVYFVAETVLWYHDKIMRWERFMAEPILIIGGILEFRGRYGRGNGTVGRPKSFRPNTTGLFLPRKQSRGGHHFMSGCNRSDAAAGSNSPIAKCGIE